MTNMFWGCLKKTEKKKSPTYYYKVVLRRESDGAMLSIYDGTTEWKMGRYTRAACLYVFTRPSTARDKADAPSWWNNKSALKFGPDGFAEGHTPVVLRCVARGVASEVDTPVSIAGTWARATKRAFRAVKPVAVLSPDNIPAFIKWLQRVMQPVGKLLCWLGIHRYRGYRTGYDYRRFDHCVRCFEEWLS